MDPRINVITLGVKDFDRSVAFYHDGLGWTAQVQDDIAFFPLNGIIFALYPRDSLAKDAAVPARKPVFRDLPLPFLQKMRTKLMQRSSWLKISGAVF